MHENPEQKFNLHDIPTTFLLCSTLTVYIVAVPPCGTASRILSSFLFLTSLLAVFGFPDLVEFYHDYPLTAICALKTNIRTMYFFYFGFDWFSFFATMLWSIFEYGTHAVGDHAHQNAINWSCYVLFWYQNWFCHCRVSLKQLCDLEKGVRASFCRISLFLSV